MPKQKQTQTNNSKSKNKHRNRQKLQEIRLHIKTEKCIGQTSICRTPKQPLFASRIYHEDDTPVVSQATFLNFVSVKNANEIKGLLGSERLNFASVKFKKTQKLPQIQQHKLIRKNVTEHKSDSVSIREEVSLTALERRKKVIESQFFKKSTPSKSMKIAFKELLPIKQISKEDKIERFKLIRHEFQSLVNRSNHIAVKNQEIIFRAYVQKGNNGILVKEQIRKRWWWHFEEKDSSKANFIWTEWFNKAATLNMNDISAQHLKTCQIDYSKIIVDSAEPKLNFIKQLVDETMFSQIKPRISLKNMNYFKNNHNKSINGQNQNKPNLIEIDHSINNIIHNHIDGCLQLHSKKLLFKNFYNFIKKKTWDPFRFIPLTFYVDDTDSISMKEMLDHFDVIETSKESTNCKNVWIIKPGQNSNRGFGITIHDNKEDIVKQIKKRLEKKSEEHFNKSLIIQKYIEDCFLINKRKFDLRCFILLTTVNGILKGYWYNDGYIRTSSEEYNFLDIHNLMVHLTNDAVQKKNNTYGKYQDFNKMSFFTFKKYLQKHQQEDSAFDRAYDEMKLIAYYLIASVSKKIRRKQYTFELFGLDFMLDAELKPLLIEANSNPCLDTSGVILGKLIPELVDNVLMTAVDPLFPPPNKLMRNGKEFISKDYFQTNKFELIFSDVTTQQ